MSCQARQEGVERARGRSVSEVTPGVSKPNDVTSTITPDAIYETIFHNVRDIQDADTDVASETDIDLCSVSVPPPPWYPMSHLNLNLHRPRTSSMPLRRENKGGWGRVRLVGFTQKIIKYNEVLVLSAYRSHRISPTYLG